jgi:hypothetical protein
MASLTVMLTFRFAARSHKRGMRTLRAAKHARDRLLRVECLVVNITAHLKTAPNDPETLYLLGRVNALAFVCKSKTLKVYTFNTKSPDDLPALDKHYNDPQMDSPNKANEQELNKYLSDAITNYRAAIEMAPRVALYRLSLASQTPPVRVRARPQANIACPPVRRTRTARSGRDGYQALEALDDSGDSVLSGNELRGLAVWRDLNSYGIADPGEVTPIEEIGIAHIAVHADATVTPGPSPASTSGIRMKDGRVLPSFDWTIMGPGTAVAGR